MSKNTRTRILLTAVAALLLVTMAVGGTLAWLVDSTDEVKNTFTTANVDIDLDEDSEDEFKMIPGTTYTKDPYVTVADGSESCWVFIEVVAANNVQNFITYSVDTTKWTKLDGATNHDGGEVYYYNTRLTGGDTKYYILTGNEVTVNNITNQDMENLNEETYPTLTFYAYACQSQNVDNVNDAWNNAKGAAIYPTVTNP